MRTKSYFFFLNQVFFDVISNWLHCCWNKPSSWHPDALADILHSCLKVPSPLRCRVYHETPPPWNNNNIDCFEKRLVVIKTWPPVLPGLRSGMTTGDGDGVLLSLRGQIWMCHTLMLSVLTWWLTPVKAGIVWISCMYSWGSFIPAGQLRWRSDGFPSWRGVSRTSRLKTDVRKRDRMALVCMLFQPLSESTQLTSGSLLTSEPRRWHGERVQHEPSSSRRRSQPSCQRFSGD